MKKKITDEEKVALSLGKVVSDLRIDLEMVGYYLAYLLPNVAYRRLMIVVDAMEETKNNKANVRG